MAISFFSNLSPLLFVLLTAVLPIILTSYCRREGYIGIAELNASLLPKLSYFIIVQIFFVQALSGGVHAALEEIIRDWTTIVELLATTVPTQVKSFIQFVQVQNFLGCANFKTPTSWISFFASAYRP